MRREILELQRQLSLTTIFVTHDQEEANTTSDRIAVLNDGIIQQMGSPMELYDQPANRFVANFLGIANLIDGTVTETEGTVLFRAPDGINIPLEGVGAGTGENKTIMFRPQNLIICDAGDPPAENKSKLSGRVQRREFLGNIVRYAVSVGEHSLLIDDTHQTGHGAFDVGADVALYLSPDQMRLLPK
jgi:iron(III) transport system ATP-binding protein